MKTKAKAHYFLNLDHITFEFYSLKLRSVQEVRSKRYRKLFLLSLESFIENYDQWTGEIWGDSPMWMLNAFQFTDGDMLSLPIFYGVRDYNNDNYEQRNEW
jgi:hypothetical protein